MARRTSYRDTASLLVQFAASLSCLAMTACGESADRPPALDPGTDRSGAPLSALQQAYDTIAYELDLEILPDERAIRGTAQVRLRAVRSIPAVELDFDPRFHIDSVQVDGDAAGYRREGGKIRVDLEGPAAAEETLSVSVQYEGEPWVGENPPWDGGFVWSTAEDGSPWVATAVHTRGCDLWFPCKDHYGDKPDVVELKITVPAGVSAVANGVLLGISELEDGRRTFHWRETNPVADYNIAINVGPYVRIQSVYPGINGTDIPLEFWALRSREEKARRLVETDVRSQLRHFERRLGPWPWGTSKIGFVETPHLGMEHQSVNAYGNAYERDPHGFDWLLHHELAHEWFGNLMTHRRAADAWLHEGTGTYMQWAYSRDLTGGAAYTHRLYETWLKLENCQPVISAPDADLETAFHPDIYNKGALVLHTLRGFIGDEAFWRSLRRLLYDTAEPRDLTYPIAPRYRSTEDFIEIVSAEAGRDLRWFFDAYLRHPELPALVAERDGAGLALQWEAPGGQPFPLPVTVSVDGEQLLVDMRQGEGRIDTDEDAHVLIDPDMAVLRDLPIIGDCDEQPDDSAH